MKTKHTPAPWFIRKVDIGHPAQGFQVEHEANGIRSIIADCRDYAVCEEHGTAEANAQLIAIAPAMFDLIEQFGNTVTDMFEHMERGNWVDDNGHNVTMNAAMIALKKPVLDAIALRVKLKP